MKTAVTVIALVLVVVIGLQLTVGARIAERLGAVRGIFVPARNTPVRIGLGLLFLAGGLLVLGKPRVSVVVFVIGAAVGIVGGSTFMGIVSGVLAVMSYFGAREVAKQEP